MIRESVSGEARGVQNPSQPPASQDLRRRAESIMEREGLQRELPEHAEIAKPSSAGDAPGSANVITTLISFVLVGIALVIVIALVVRWLISWVEQRREKGIAVADDAVGDAQRKVVHVELSEAEALAAEGRFIEAVHVMLLRAIEAVSDLERVVVSPADTSRELLVDLDIPAGARTELENLVDFVETGLFAGQSLTQGDYDAGRRALDRFLDHVNRVTA